MDPNEIPTTAVSSSNINALGYDEESQILIVVFSNGAKYRYSGVSMDEFMAFLKAPSIGKHFYQDIKPKYTGYRV